MIIKDLEDHAGNVKAFCEKENFDGCDYGWANMGFHNFRKS